MATAALLRSLRRCDVASVPFYDFRSFTSISKLSYLGHNWTNLSRPFSSKPTQNVMEGKNTKVIENSEGAQTTPPVVKKAEIDAWKDQERKALIDVKNSVNTTIYSVEKSLGKFRDKIPSKVAKDMKMRRSQELPLRQLTMGTVKSAGRNSSGRITSFHRGGGSKRLYRRIDLKRSTLSMGIVERIEYDPNRSSRIALVRWIEGVPYQSRCNMIEEFAPTRKILEPTTSTIRGIFLYSSLPV